MSKAAKPPSLVAAALLLSGLSLVGGATGDARAESAYPNVEDLPPGRDTPRMTVDEQSKLKKELNDARDRQTSSQVKAGGNAARPKPKKP
jgi:hypothetical protein